MITRNKRYSNIQFRKMFQKLRSRRFLLLRLKNINSYIQNKLIEMKKVSEFIKNRQLDLDLQEQVDEVEVDAEEQDTSDNDERIGLYNIILDSLINNIKDDFKEEKEDLENECEKNTQVTNIDKDKILVVVSCHTNNSLRLKSIQLIMRYLKQVENIDIVLVNSKGLPLSDYVKNYYKNDYCNYYEVHNDQYYGFSKWYYGLIQQKFMNYKYITFINDSILIHHPIKHFFDYTRFKDVDFYGYNDSSQCNHHYQSYFFSIKNTAIVNFLKMFDEKRKLVHSYMDAVIHFELSMFQYFVNRDCFLKIAHLPFHQGKNIFSDNDLLYFNLRNYGLLPFTKLKRIANI